MKRNFIDDYIDACYNEKARETRIQIANKHQDAKVSKAKHPHIWEYLYDEVWVCKRCNELIWMPITVQDAARYTKLIQTIGNPGAYESMLEDKDAKYLIDLMKESLEC